MLALAGQNNMEQFIQNVVVAFNEWILMHDDRCPFFVVLHAALSGNKNFSRLKSFWQSVEQGAASPLSDNEP